MPSYVRNTVLRLFKSTSMLTYASSLTETSLVPSGNGDLTVRANMMDVGGRLRARGSGFYTVPAITGGALTTKIKFGGTAIATKATTGLLVGGSNLPFDFDITITFLTLGTAGTAILIGNINYTTGTLLGLMNTVTRDPITSGNTPFTVNTTIDNALDFTGVWDSATAGRSVTIAFADVVLI